MTLSDADAGSIIDEYGELYAAADAAEPLKELAPWVKPDEDGDNVCMFCGKWRCGLVRSSHDRRDTRPTCRMRDLALKAVER